MSAKDLIAAKGAARVPHPSAEAVKEVGMLCQHNDTRTGPRRVGAHQAIRMLQEEHKWAGRTRADLDKLCRVMLNRASWGAP